MPRGGARPGAGRPKAETASSLRSMQKLNVEIKRDIDRFKHDLRAGFAEGVSELAGNFPALIRKRIEAALAGDDKAADMLIMLYARFFQPDSVVTVQDSHPIADFARRMREEMMRLTRGDDDVIEGTAIEIVDTQSNPVESGGSGAPQNSGHNA